MGTRSAISVVLSFQAYHLVGLTSPSRVNTNAKQFHTVIEME